MVQAWSMTTTGAFSDVSLSHHSLQCKQINSPAILEPYVHRGQTTHLAEDLLLASLGSNGLSQQLANLTRVEMVDETPDPGLSEASQTLHEVEPFSNGVVWVIIDALLGRSLAEHICQKGRVSGFLIGHELNQRHVFGADASLKEIGF